MNALALVIGNADYSLEKDKLVNAVNDAQDVSNKLLNLGFIVNEVIDCNRETFDREIRKFGNDLKQYDIGLFYFSGHGLQIEGNNYLTSIDTSFVDDISAKNTSFPLSEIIEYMQRAKSIINILILDACRDNPLPSQYRGINSQGLAPIYAPKGTIIAFSTSPGEKAMDYGAGRNSIYTGAFLNHIDDVNIPIEDFFKRVRTSVYTLSKGKQTSWEHTSLIGNFCFNSGQLIHSTDLPYKQEYIADENFQSKGTEVDEIIVKLKTYDWYKQEPAIKKISKLNFREIGISEQFLLGRNILQTAIGGEFSANSIIKNLNSWLQSSIIDGENHILNGILFEIYFDSKGHFRQENFKCYLIDDIFYLQGNDQYKSSFEFINRQLQPFADFLFYIPSVPHMTLAIEIQFEEVSWTVGEATMTAHKLTSVKQHHIEYLEDFDNDNDFNAIQVNYKQFIQTLQKELCVPLNHLRLSMNVKEEDLKRIYIPWDFKLKKKK
ncbi:Peptidase C14 [Tenacibaculum maritimum]|uniref:caspase family protein n=1 Tax=Tenacibaculum maritimum TaxID=107401 RepID=UPI0012E64F15|nr:caspase family protein [Tenacibaculum maritimum]CAA0155120.1 Peptidase C14 [Tenacibaculum maritimum]